RLQRTRIPILTQTAGHGGASELASGAYQRVGGRPRPGKARRLQQAPHRLPRKEHRTVRLASLRRARTAYAVTEILHPTTLLEPCLVLLYDCLNVATKNRTVHRSRCRCTNRWEVNIPTRPRT